MATLEQLQQALVAADKAGATEDARALANAILAIKGGGQVKPDPPRQSAPAEDPGIGQSLLIGAGRTFDRVAKGMQQLYYGATNNAEGQAKLKTAAEDDNEAYAGLQKLRPWATGIGEALPSAVIPLGGAPTLLGNAARMGVAGALPASLEYGTAGERMKGAALGAAGGAAIPVLGAGAKTAWSVLEPLVGRGRQAIVGRTLNRAAGDAAPEVLSRLRGATELVPGSRPTAAQVAESGGIAALERAAAASNPEAYTQRFMEQSSARLGALRGIAKDDAAMEAATGARDTVTAPLYAAAKGKTADNVPELASVLSSLPDEVMSKARRLAKLAGEELKQGKDLPARTEASKITDQFGLPILTNLPAETSRYSGKALHYIKLALDDSLSKTGEGSLGNVEKGLMTGAKEKLLAAIDAQIPEYGAARTQFAALSKPVNQMEVGRGLLDKAAPALADFGALGRETGATFANALRNGDATAARATGFKGSTMADVLTPDQMALVNSVARDLGRKANAQDLGRGVGSDTFQKLSMQNLANQSGMPRVVGGLLELPGVSQGLKWAYRDTDQKMQGLLADALLDPQKAAELMGKASKKWMEDNPKTRRLLEQAVVRGGGLLGMSAPAALPQMGN